MRLSEYKEKGAGSQPDSGCRRGDIKESEGGMKKNKPSGFIAICPDCKVIIGALDRERMNYKDVGKMLGDWLMDGYIIEPRYNSWQETIQSCRCTKSE